MHKVTAPVCSFVLFLFTFTLASFSLDGYSIKGKVKGWHDTICFLGNHYGEKKYIKDTSRVDKEGNFSFSGKEKLPGGIYLIVFPNKIPYEFLVNAEQHFYMDIDTASTVKRMKFKGSEENTLFYKYLNFINEEQEKAAPLRKVMARLKSDSVAALTTKKDSIKGVQEKLTAIDKEVEAYMDKFKKEHPGNLLTLILRGQSEPIIPETPTLPNGRKDSTFPYRYYKEHYWDNISLTDERLLRTPVFHSKLKYYFDKVVMQNPDSTQVINREIDSLVKKTKGNKEMFKYIIWYLTPTYESNPIMGMDAVFVHLVETYYMTWQAYWIDSTQNLKIINRGVTLKPLLLGKPAPVVTMQDTLDRSVSLYDLKSKYTVVVFWDPDCGHCQKVIPKLKELYDTKLKAKGVTVYSVDIEDDSEKWKKFIREKKLDWINVHDKYKQYYLRQMYDIYSTPVIYLLDENKRIRAKRIDAEQLDGFIDHLEKMKELQKKTMK